MRVHGLLNNYSFQRDTEHSYNCELFLTFEKRYTFEFELGIFVPAASQYHDELNSERQDMLQE